MTVTAKINFLGLSLTVDQKKELAVKIANAMQCCLMDYRETGLGGWVNVQGYQPSFTFGDCWQCVICKRITNERPAKEVRQGPVCKQCQEMGLSG